MLIWNSNKEVNYKYALLIFMILSTKTVAKDVFDYSILQSLGYDQAAADYLSEKSKFSPGYTKVNIVVNGVNMGEKNIEFDMQGNACWKDDVLTSLNINPSSFKADNNGCYLVNDEDKVKISEDVGKNSIEMRIPLSFVSQGGNYLSGGKALLFNYNANAIHSRPDNGNSLTNKTLTTEVGANFENWIFRSRQSYYQYQNESNSSRLYTYVQRTFSGIASIVQVGEISTKGRLYGGLSITGVQISPENALQGQDTVSINTVISFPSQVDVYQKNVLLKTFNVDAGVVVLDDIPIINRSDDFILHFINNNGDQSQQRLPFIQAVSNLSMSGTEGMTVALGKLRMSEKDYSLAMISGGLYSNSFLSTSVGAVVSDSYQSAAIGANISLAGNLISTISQTYSMAQGVNDGYENNNNLNGVKNDISLSYGLSDNVSLTASANYRTPSYIDIDSSYSSLGTASTSGRIRVEYSSGVNLRAGVLGTFSVIGSRANYYNDTTTNGFMLNWANNIGKANINIGVQNNKFNMASNKYNDRYAYVNVSIPFGSNSSMRSFVTRSNGSERVGVGYNQTVNSQFSYNVDTERNTNGNSSVSATGYYLSKYAKTSMGVSTGDGDAYSLSAQGSAVLHSGGLTFSPQLISDTFGIISLSSKESNVEIDTPSGKVWTDRQGQAITSTLPWKKNRIQVNTRNLKKNLEVGSGISEVSPFRGAVLPIHLPVLSVKRAMVIFEGTRLPSPGASVKNDKGDIVAFVNEDNSIFFDNLPDGDLHTTDNYGMTCNIYLIDSYQFDEKSLYASLKARCQNVQ